MTLIFGCASNHLFCHSNITNVKCNQMLAKVLNKIDTNEEVLT
jgi:hypothetical protein